MNPTRNLLVIDDDEGLLDSLEVFFSLRGWDVTTCSDPVDAIETHRKRKMQIILMDIMMPKIDGIQLLKEFKKLTLPIDIIIMTGQTTTTRAYDAWTHGAFDYVLKPFPSLEGVEQAVLRAEENQQRWRSIGFSTMKTVRTRGEAI